MSVDTTEKQKNFAVAVVTANNEAMTKLEELAALKAEMEESGLVLDDAVLQTLPATKHVAGSDITAVLSSWSTVMDYAETNFHTTNFQKARP